MGQATLNDFQRERKALDAVLSSGAFLPSSNPARLLAYVCEKHFEDPGRDLTEYDIATGALGRRSDFDARRDSVVRVEVHRLRKRLKEFYAAEGSGLPMQIVLPPGQYAPQFVNPARPAESVHEGSTARRFYWAWYLAAAMAIAAIAFWGVRANMRKSQPAVTPAAPPIAAAQSEVRILAGIPSAEYIDQYGHLWSGDAYFSGGNAVEVRYTRLARTADPALYQHARLGFEFGYDIPLKPGVYQMRLHFAESSMHVPIVGDSGESLRRFRVMANQKQLLPPVDARHARQFDIFSDTGGEDLADVKIFKDISPADDGRLHLKFISDKQEALVNAIEIVPGVAGKMQAVRLCAASRPIVDNHGSVWLPDSFSQGGRLSVFNRPITGTEQPALFQGERFGHFTYTIPVAPGRYTVSLGFAENYHTIWDQAPGKGARLFNVYINGVMVLRDFDVFGKAGGALQAINRTFRDVEPTPQDKIVIAFEPVTESAIVNTVEIIDQGGKL